MVRRKNTTMFLDAKESTPVLEVKKILKGILKASLEDMQLYKDGVVIDETKTLGAVGYTNFTAKVGNVSKISISIIVMIRVK